MTTNVKNKAREIAGHAEDGGYADDAVRIRKAVDARWPDLDEAIRAEIAREAGGMQGVRLPFVFLVNEPLKRNIDGELERWLPLETLGNFGEVVRCLPDGSPPADLGPYLDALRAKLAGYRDGDFIALVGDQSLLTAAAMIVGAKTGATGKVRFLKWERRKEAYAPVVVDLGGVA